jgi:hypothetical protein
LLSLVTKLVAELPKATNRASFDIALWLAQESLSAAASLSATLTTVLVLVCGRWVKLIESNIY